MTVRVVICLLILLAIVLGAGSLAYDDAMRLEQMIEAHHRALR